MRKQFCCDASRSLYEDYYVKQSGSGLAHFSGARMQRGHGLTNILNGLFRRAWPIIQIGAKAFVRQFLRTVLQVANDVADGQTIKESGMKRVPEGIKLFVSSNFFKTQSGSGRKTPKRKVKRTIKRPMKRSKKDIFDEIL